MEPDNAQYRQVLTNLEEGGDAYRRHAGSYQGYGSLGELCMPLCLCWGRSGASAPDVKTGTICGKLPEAAFRFCPPPVARSCGEIKNP